MTLLSYVVQIVFIYAFTRLTWFLVRPLVRKDPLAVLPVPSGGSYFLGHAAKLFGGQETEYQAKFDEKGLVCNLGSFFGTPTLLLSDPKALHHVLVKDQHIFEETHEAFALRDAVWGQGLLSTFGEQHKRQRKMLNPVFSINHMRGMVPTFHEIGSKLSATLGRMVADGRQEIEIFQWLSRGALELIGRSGFGHSFHSLAEDEQEHPYMTAVKELAPLLFKTAILQILFLPVVHKWNLGGRAFQRWFMDNLTWGSVRALKRIVDIMDRTAQDIYEGRKKALETGDVLDESGKDILTILMRSNMESSEEDKLPEHEIVGQVSTFVFAGMDTTASALCRFLWLLAQHQDVQDRLRQEIRDAKAKYGQLDYDQLVALPYLDAVCRETFEARTSRHPPVAVITRTTLKDTVLPLSQTVRGNDGQELAELVVPAGTTIFVSIQGCNRAPGLWGPDALEWKPERWISDLPKDLVDAKVPGIYSHLLTFLGGGRACIGFKFAQLELKTMALHLLDGLKFSLTDKPITWRSFGIVTPAVDRNKVRPELPMLVELAE
ncbi:cytochrome P450 [Coprinopsis sp. MPI-PUGE-AT-0042]|nr:cytochrome P450 [Coprinopsis sp. MPI-PUGE-AT-0042]